MGNKFYNKDGLVIRFGTRVEGEDEDVASQTSTAGKVQEITLKVRDATTIPVTDATSVSAGEFANSAFIPANATIISARIKTDTPLASGGAADLIVGTYTIDATTGLLVVVDANGILDEADSALADFSVAGETVFVDKASTAALVGKTTVGANPVVVAVARLVATYTAGALTITVEYSEEG